MSISGNSSIGPSISGYSDKVLAGSTTRDTAGASETVPLDPATKKENRKDIERAMENLNKFFQPNNTHLKFTLHERLNEYYVQIVDGNDQVVREIPSKKMMDMVANMKETLGILFDEKR